MNTGKHDSPLILVVEAVPGIRDGIEKLLATSGYRIATASDEQSAAAIARRIFPDLILVCLGEPPSDFIAAASRIRADAQPCEEVPLVIFCQKAVAEGEEVDFGRNVYAISPDNFNQLRNFLKSLLNASLIAT